MCAILEKIKGERVILVCKQSDISENTKRISLVDGKDKVQIDNCNVVVPKNCFSISEVAHIILPKQIKFEDIKKFEQLECMN